ncbi:MAG: hypothetical protein GY717_08115 [Rhodobacteraceae bacterium]|nr:hypothetical protein [Paracoccaceae bacterium]
MAITKFMVSFLRSEDGAVTADWVLLSACCIGLAIALTFSIGTTAMDHSTSIGDLTVARGIPTY